MNRLAVVAGIMLWLSSGGGLAAPPEAAPAPPVQNTASALVPPVALRARPRFISGKTPDAHPKIVALGNQGRFGRVVAQATVTAAGTLADIILVTPSGEPSVDAAVIDALKTWKLSPAIDKTGAKVATQAKFPFSLGSMPTLQSKLDIAMPEAARIGFHNGKVMVTFTIDPAGKPTQLQVTQSSKSEILDTAVLNAVAQARYSKPLDLLGKPVSVEAAFAQNFSQAKAGGGSYLSGLKSYRCATFIGELDWWTQAHPGQKISDLEFYTAMSGMAFIAPEAFGWGKTDVMTGIGRHPKAWDHAVTACRTAPGSTFLEEYKRG